MTSSPQEAIVSETILLPVFDSPGFPAYVVESGSLHTMQWPPSSIPTSKTYFVSYYCIASEVERGVKTGMFRIMHDLF